MSGQSERARYAESGRGARQGRRISWRGSCGGWTSSSPGSERLSSNTRRSPASRGALQVADRPRERLDEGEAAICDELARLGAEVDGAAELDGSLAPIARSLESSRAELSDAARALATPSPAPCGGGTLSGYRSCCASTGRRRPSSSSTKRSAPPPIAHLGAGRQACSRRLLCAQPLEDAERRKPQMRSVASSPEWGARRSSWRSRGRRLAQGTPSMWTAPGSKRHRARPPHRTDGEDPRPLRRGARALLALKRVLADRSRGSVRLRRGGRRRGGDRRGNGRAISDISKAPAGAVHRAPPAESLPSRDDAVRGGQVEST